MTGVLDDKVLLVNRKRSSSGTLLCRLRSLLELRKIWTEQLLQIGWPRSLPRNCKNFSSGRNKFAHRDSGWRFDFVHGKSRVRANAKAAL